MTSESHLLRGKSASSGYATGRPVVVTSVADLAKVKTGDILVASETQVAFVSAMSRASAIITEQGGRFCHAAVWARENEKPAVIQAEDATRLLADLPLIRVDACQGLISWEAFDGR